MIPMNTILVHYLIRRKKHICMRDWIAFADDENGWGPGGGNTFLSIEDSLITLSEVRNFWRNGKEAVSELTATIPTQCDPGEFEWIASIVNFHDQELWFSIFDNESLGDIGKPPTLLVGMNILTGQARFYSAQDFYPKLESKFLPYISKIAFIDKRIILLGKKKGYFVKTSDSSMIEKHKNIIKENIVIYYLDEKKGLFLQPEPQTIETEFGKFSISLEIEDNAVLINRTFTNNYYAVESDKFAELEEFKQQIKDSDKLHLVLSDGN